MGSLLTHRLRVRFDGDGNAQSRGKQFEPERNHSNGGYTDDHAGADRPASLRVTNAQASHRPATDDRASHRYAREYCGGDAASTDSGPLWRATESLEL